MDEWVINDLYERAKSKGYKKSLDEFKTLLYNDQGVFDDMYGYVQSKGYKKGTEEFSTLIGKNQSVQQPTVKKKDDGGISESEPSKTELETDLFGRAQKVLSIKEPQQEQVEPIKRPETTEEASGTWGNRAKKEQPLSEPLSDYMQVYGQKKGEGVLAPTKPLDFVGRMTPELVKERTPKFLEDGLNSLTPKQLASYGAKGAKETFDYYFKDAGFKFETDREYVRAISPDGEVYTYNTLYPSSKALDEFKNFVRESAFNNPEIADKAYLYEKENKKFKTKEAINNEVKSINAQEEQFMGDYKKFLNLKRDIDEIEADLKRFRDFGEQNTPKYIQTEAYLNERKKELQDYAGTMDSKAEVLEAQRTQLDKAVGKYTEFQATQGDFLGNLYRSIANTSSGIFSNYLRLAVTKSVDFMPLSSVMGEEAYQSALDKKLKEKGYEGNVVPIDVLKEAEAEVESEIGSKARDDFKKAAITGKYQGEQLNNVLTVNGVRESLSEFMNKPITSTQEYLQERQEKGSFIERGLYGFAGSLPAMVGGPALRYMNMFMMTTDGALQEMDNNPNFADISENEKELVALPIGVVGAVLEELGLKNLKLGKSITSSILKIVLGRVPVNATASTIRRTTFDVLAERGIRAGTTYAGGILSEMETGLLQQANDYAVKDIYSAMKEKKMFDNPAFLTGQYLYDLWDASRTEGVGAGVTSVPYSIAAAYQKDGFQALDDATFKIFEDLAKDDNGRKFFVTSLKNKINLGEVTLTQGKQMIEAYDQASGMIGMVPDEITDPESRKVAMDLMSERKKLEKQKYGKDEALAKPIQNKIDKINEQLTQLTEDAIQKQAASEVSLQPETEPSKEMEAGGPEAGPQKSFVDGIDQLLAAQQAPADTTPAATTATPTTTEVTPAEVIEKTPEQEADLLEELMTGKKKEPAVEPAVEIVAEEENKPEIPKAEEVAETDIEIKDIEATPEEIQKQVEEFDEEALPEEEKPKPGLVAELAIEDINADPERFQFKEVTDKEAGVTEQFKGKLPFNKEYAGVISVWVDPADGKTYVINGHHRLEFAKRSGEKTMNVIYIEAKDASEARLKGAMQNIAENMGTDMDAAKVFRETGMTVEQLQSRGINVKGAKAINGLALASLSDNLFNLVVQGKLSQTVGIIIGNTIKNKTVQEQFYNVIKGKNLNNGTIKVMAEDIQAAPTENVEQMDLFGVTATEQASYQQRASFIAGIRAIVSKAKNILGKAAKSKGFLEEYGNDIDEIASETGSRESAMALAVFDRLRNTSPEIRALIDKGVERIKNGENKNKVLNETAKQIIEATPRILEGVTGQPVAGRGEVKEPSTKGKQGATGKKLADAVRKNLKIKGPDGLQSNILGIPIAIWNAGVETMAKAIEAGVAINKAVQKAIEYIKENHGKKFNEASVEKKLLIGQYKGAIEIAREAKVTNEGLKTYFKRQGLTDAQIETLLKVKEKAEKRPISKEKVIGKPKPKKVTVNEMTALKDQLRLEARAAREAKGDLNAKRKMLTAAIKEMKKKGSISVRQAKALINRVNAVNLDNPIMVERLLDYAEKVFNDAAYAEKLSQANKLQSQIKQLPKNKDKFGNLTPFAAEFAKIDPAMVENIDEYIEMASKVKEGVQGSKIVGDKVIPADMVDVGATMEYVNKTMEAQEEAIRLKTAERLQELMGVDVSDLTYDQMMELLDTTTDKKVDKYKEGIIRGFIDRMFNTYSTIINDMFETGIDPFSDPNNPTTVDFKDSDKKIVEEFMAMDLSLLDAKEALRAADALNNFLTNKSTAGMLATLGDYNGRKNIKEVADKNIKAKQIKMYWSPVLGKAFFQQIASIPAFFDRLFKSYKTGRYIREMMGINSLINHKADAVTAANRVINNYILEFSKKKPNNKNFQDISNIIERGIIGDLAKTIVGDAKQVEVEFNRRKKLIEQSIKILEESGTKKETEQAKVMKEVYDKIAKDSKTIEEVKAKADQVNVDAVQFWVDQWAKLYDQFADVALNVYNRVLDKNVNYVPDRFGFLERAEKKKKDADGFESMFVANSNSEYFYKKEAGSLMKSTPPQSLLDEDGNSMDMYVNLSFDTNNANALMEALIDIKTAADIRQIQAFKNDSKFKNVFPFGKDAAAVKERIAALIRNIRNKRAITDKSFKEMVRKMDRIAAIGTSLLLAGPTQAISQTIPVAINTLINSGGKLNLSNINNKDVNRFIDESGMDIANRGSDAVTELETLNQKLEVAAKTKAGAAVQYIENLNRKYLKLYLSNFDVFIARASWITYYEKGLRKQGIKGKVDYSKDKLNKEAAQYAQDMIDRQQNISDKDLAGQLYQSDNPVKQFIVKIVMPLATFRMNQTTRFSNDLAILTSKTASTEERKEAAVSIGGFAAEMATFRAIKLYIGYYVFYSLAQMIRGEEDDEEEKQKTWDNMKRGAATSVVSDVFSPIPQTDVPTKILFAGVLDQLQNIAGVGEDDKFNIFTESKSSFTSDWGLLGVGVDKMIKLGEKVELARTGKFKDDFGNEKTISESDRALLSNPLYIGINVATVLGLNPLAPETDNVMNRITKMAKKNAITDKQIEEGKELGVEGKKDLTQIKAEDKSQKEEAYGNYKTLEEFEKKEPEKFDEYSAPGGKLDKYREKERLEFEKKNKDEPFRGLSEKKFKELYPKEWAKNYGPGTAYFQKQNSPAMLQKKAQEKMREAQREQKRKMAEAKRKQQEILKKASGR
jgi:uncharacterized protein YbjQ (UPF0145 family)